jgi:adenine/guanine/hypoxanthine permease
MLERLFSLCEHGPDARTEILGGATTFVTMTHIIVVKPAILSFAGIPCEPSIVATILTSGVLV